MKWVCSPKFYGPLTIWPWLRISPHSSLNVIYYLIISVWQWLMSFMYMPCILMQINPIKAHWGAGFWPFYFERLATFPPQADHVLVNLFSSMVGRDFGGPWRQSPPHSCHLLCFCESNIEIDDHNLGRILSSSPNIVSIVSKPTIRACDPKHIHHYHHHHLDFASV